MHEHRHFSISNQIGLYISTDFSMNFYGEFSKFSQCQCVWDRDATSVCVCVCHGEWERRSFSGTTGDELIRTKEKNIIISIEKICASPNLLNWFKIDSKKAANNLKTTWDIFFIECRQRKHPAINWKTIDNRLLRKWFFDNSFLIFQTIRFFLSHDACIFRWYRYTLLVSVELTRAINQTKQNADFYLSLSLIRDILII